MRVWAFLRLAVDADDLLTRRMRHARKNTSLGDGRIALILQHTAHGNALMTEILQQQATGFIVTDKANGKYIDAEIGQIVGCIGPAAGQNGTLAVLQDQYRRFTRNAGDFSEDKFVSNQISQDRDRDLGEGLDNLLQPVGFFGVLRHRVRRRYNSKSKSTAADRSVRS